MYLNYLNLDYRKAHPEVDYSTDAFYNYCFKIISDAAGKDSITG